MEKQEFVKKFSEIFNSLGFVCVKLDNNVSITVKKFFILNENTVVLMIGNVIVSTLQFSKIKTLY